VRCPLGWKQCLRQRLGDSHRALQAMSGRIAFDALKNRGELAALGAAALYGAGTPVAKVLLGTPAVLAT
jgi:hypothetical protein